MNHQNYSRQNYNKSRYTNEYSKYLSQGNKDESGDNWKYTNNESRYKYNKDNKDDRLKSFLFLIVEYNYKHSNNDYHPYYDRHSHRDSSEKHEKHYSEDEDRNERKWNHENSKITSLNTNSSQKNNEDEDNQSK